MTDNTTMDENLLNGKTFLVVDDETDLRDIVASELEFMGAKVYQAENISGAEKILNETTIDLVVSDIRMPGGTGIDLLNHIKAKNVQSPPIILITGFADITVEDAFNQGAEALMNKPFKLDDLIKLAVKFTHSLRSRYSEEVSGARKELKLTIPDSIQNRIDAKEFLLGRGGLALKFPYEGTKFELGDVIKFNLKFDGVTLEGSAVCRWFKLGEQGSFKASLGIEFMHLSDESLNYLLDFWQNELPVSYIPSFEAK